MKHFAAAILALGLVACGGQAGGPSATSPAPSVSKTTGPFHDTATPARLAAGGTVHLTLTVTGPMEYEAGCVQTLRIWAVNAANEQVWSQPQPMIVCQALGLKTLGSGETARFNADWPTSSSLQAGAYTLHGLFLTYLPPGAGMRVRENLPPLAIQISG